MPYLTKCAGRALVRQGKSTVALLYKLIATNDEIDYVAALEKYGKKINNKQLYAAGLSYNLLPKDINKALSQLEQEGKIIVSELPGQKRIRKAFYVNYSNYEKDPKIEVQWRAE